ncbi:two-component sensor histidine kinase [Streptomyces sp. ISL-43]|uniref:sensor histidine kinase n=1 Tax=Streptomyces sp. ISL-43 TaxID=2819183 RepID=UPI001BE527C0|nr:histidine kinase [Streptomyces sp. ISL-43]MBT2450159.1 two-component sensor histidine kinase [Streptomyces sp. ISL-43]
MSPLAPWARRHPYAADWIRVFLSVTLLALVTFEGVVLARRPSVPHAAVWVSGILVCLSAAPWPGIPLLARAWFAAAVTWTVTLLLIFGNHPIVVWGGGEAIALLFFLSQVLLRAPVRTAAVLGPLLGLGCMAVPVRDTDPGRFTLLFSVLAVVVGAFSLLLRLQSGQRLRELRAVRSAERLELARELHDLVAHHVTGIVVEARAARYTKVSAERAGEIFGRIENAGDEALGSMRRLVKILREGAEDGSAGPGPGAGSGAGIAPVAGLREIRGLTERFAVTGPPVVLYIEDGLETRLPADVAATAHRIVLEALTNIGKHAATATAVRIGLRTVPPGLEVRIADDGGRSARLSENARGGGYGLVGMAERAEALGGSLTAGPAPEGGWLVTAILPL